MYKDYIKGVIERMTTREKVALHNRYCELINDPFNIVTENNEDFYRSMLSKEGPKEVLRSIVTGSYDVDETYVQFNALGKFHSHNDFELPDVDEVVEHILENDWRYQDFIN